VAEVFVVEVLVVEVVEPEPSVDLVLVLLVELPTVVPEHTFLHTIGVLGFMHLWALRVTQESNSEGKQKLPYPRAAKAERERHSDLHALTARRLHERLKEAFFTQASS